MEVVREGFQERVLVNLMLEGSQGPGGGWGWQKEQHLRWPRVLNGLGTFTILKIVESPTAFTWSLFYPTPQVGHYFALLLIIILAFFFVSKRPLFFKKFNFLSKNR